MTRSFTPLTVVPCCLVPLEVVVSGLARAHCPVVAVSVPVALVVHPWLVSKLSKKIVVARGPPLRTVETMLRAVAPEIHGRGTEAGERGFIIPGVSSCIQRSHIRGRYRFGRKLLVTSLLLVAVAGAAATKSISLACLP